MYIADCVLWDGFPSDFCKTPFHLEEKRLGSGKGWVLIRVLLFLAVCLSSGK